jgi:polysaccharide deacetylase family protein (PEP-CTERM system associated)
MPPGAIVNALTVDVEDYFQVSAFERSVDRSCWDQFDRRVAANTDRLLALFADHRVRGTFFVLGWVAEREPEMVQRIAAAGHEVASHGFGHRLVYDQSPPEFRDDIRRSKAILESLIGCSVQGYRAPSFSITERSLWAWDVLLEEGFTYDASVYPIRHDRYGIPSAPREVHTLRRPAGSLVEIPGTTVRVAGMNLPAAGGGYFRLLPYAYTRAAIRHVNRAERRPAVFYMHPWEVDPGQPRLDAPWLSRFRHYTNLAATEGRLRRLLGEFRFAPIVEAILPLAASSAGQSSNSVIERLA